MERMEAAVESTNTTTIPVDIEHSGLRLAVVVTFLVGGFVAYLVLGTLIPSAGLNLIAIIGAFAVAYGLTALLERALKTRWPSGRSVQIDRSGIRLINNGLVEQSISAGDAASPLFWRFQTKRRSRVPKGWHVLAVALEQNQRMLSVYTFMSPEQLKNFDLAERFRVLQSAKEKTDGARGRDQLLLAGEQRRLMEAETARWQAGAEMTADAFRDYLARLAALFPEWMRPA